MCRTTLTEPKLTKINLNLNLLLGVVLVIVSHVLAWIYYKSRNSPTNYVKLIKRSYEILINRIYFMYTHIYVYL